MSKRSRERWGQCFEQTDKWIDCSRRKPGCPSISECAGHKGQTIPKSYDPPLNNPEGM